MIKYFLIIITLFSSFINLSLYPLTEQNIYKILYQNSLIPHNTELRKRVLTTIYCDDCSYLPKVEHAGKTFYDEISGLEYQLMHNGLKIYKDCYYGSWMTTLIQLLHGHHEPQEEKMFHEVLKYLPHNPIMIELGSYWGYYSMWMKKNIPNAQVYLIEPDPKNIIIGQKNFELNKLSGIFEQGMIDSTSSDQQTFIDWGYNEHTVQAISIDDFAQKHNIQFIHLLHSDIQGAEILMLKGCHKLMSEKRIGYYFISTHRGTHKKCLQILQNYDLEILISITRKESFSADGLIVAKLPEIASPSDVEVTRRSKSFCQFLNGVIHGKDNTKNNSVDNHIEH